MEFDAAKTLGGFLVLYGIVAVGTAMSPMTTETVVMVLGGLLVFGAFSLYIGVKHGEYRATHA